MFSFKPVSVDPQQALLLPPFADLLALVNTTLFLCGAADRAVSQDSSTVVVHSAGWVGLDKVGRGL